VILTAQNNVNYWVGSPANGTVTIQPASTITITANGTGTAAEFGPVTGSFTVTRTGGDQSQALTVNYTPSGSAGNGSSYQTLPGSVTIPANQSSATITLTPQDDGSVVWTESAILTLQASPNYWVTAPLPNATVNIVDEYADSSGDGLADFMEPIFGLNPQNNNPTWKADIDADGLPDAYETIVGLNPNVAEPAPGLPSYNICPVQ
jgi:hypothetical protein